MELATCRFIREQRDVLFTGPPGVGKSHLAQAIGRQTAKMSHYRPVQLHLRRRGGIEPGRGVRRERQGAAEIPPPDLPIIDDMGLKKLPKQPGVYLFEIIMRRYELRSTVMTSNRPLEE